MSYELKTALSKVGPTPMKFGVYRGSKGVQILISQGNPTESLLGEMLAQTGSKKSVLDGKCFKEDTTYIFASKAGENAKLVTSTMKEKASGIHFELRDLKDDDGSGNSAQPNSDTTAQSGSTGATPIQGRAQGVPQNRPAQPGANPQGIPQNRPAQPGAIPQGIPQNRPVQPGTNPQGIPQNRPVQPGTNPQGIPQNRPVQPGTNPQGIPQNRPVQPGTNPQGIPQNRPVQPGTNPQGIPQNRPAQPGANPQGIPQNRPVQPGTNPQGIPQNRPAQPGTNPQGVPQNRPNQPGPAQQGVPQNRPNQPGPAQQQGVPQNRPNQPGPAQQQGVPQNRPNQPGPAQQQGVPQNRPNQPGPAQQQGVPQNRPNQPGPGQQQGVPQNRPAQPGTNPQGIPQNRPAQPGTNPQGIPQNRPAQPGANPQGVPQNRPAQPGTNPQGIPQNRPAQPGANPQGVPQNRPAQPGANPQGVPQNRPAQPGTNPQGVPQNRPAQPGSGQQQGAPQRPNGPQVVGQRTATSLQKADVAASAVAQNAFKPGSAQTATTRLAASPVKVDRKGVANTATQFKKQGLDKAYIAEAKPNEKAKREGEVKAERDAAAKMAKAIKNASGKKVTAKQLNELEAACQKGIECYSVRVNEGVKAAKTKITRTIDDFELREADAKAEGRVFDRAPLEEQLKAARKELDARIKGPEANRLAGAIDAKLEVQLRKNEKLTADLGVALKSAEGSKTEATAAGVLKLANQYRQVFTDHAAEYAKIPGRERPIPIVQQEALIDKIIEDAQATIFDLKKTKLGPPPWTPDKQAEGEGLIDQGRELTAKNVMKSGKVHRPAGGTSEVMVLKNAQDKPAFAFKSAKGESSQMGLPPGGGAIREAVSSKVTDSILQQTGFDFGFPKSTIATIDGKVGALVEGLDGTLLPASNDIPDDKRASTAAFQNALPGKQLQKVMFAGLATGNFLDLKWDNVFFEGQGDQAVARPFDAGAAFLPSSTIDYQMYTRRPGSPPPTIGSDLLSDAEGNPTRGATAPMDAELVQAMLNIDTKALEKVIDDEVQRHAATGLDKCLDVDSKKNGIKCLTALQNVLRAHKDDAPAPSLGTVMGEVQTEILKAFPAPPKPGAKR